MQLTCNASASGFLVVRVVTREYRKQFLTPIFACLWSPKKRTYAVCPSTFINLHGHNGKPANFAHKTKCGLEHTIENQLPCKLALTKHSAHFSILSISSQNNFTKYFPCAAYFLSPAKSLQKENRS